MTDADDLRTFIRDITRRSEHVTSELIESLREHTSAMTAQMTAMTAEIRQLQLATADNSRVIRDLHEESQAQRGAILRVLDELRRERGR